MAAAPNVPEPPGSQRPRRLDLFRVRVALAVTSVVVILGASSWLWTYLQTLALLTDATATTSQVDGASAAHRAAWQTSLATMALALPLALLATAAIVRAPSRAVRDLQAFLDDLPNRIGSHLPLAGHTGAWRQTLAALNRASDLLAQQRQELDAATTATRRFAGIAQQSSLGIIVTDASGNIEWVNSGFERLTGFGLDAARGQRPRGLLNSVGAEPETLAAMAQAVRDGLAFEADILARTAAGERRWLHVDAAPIRDANGTVTGYMSIHSSADQRIEALRALQRSQQLAQTVAELSTSMLQSPTWSDVVTDALSRLATISGAAQVALYVIDSAQRRATRHDADRRSDVANTRLPNTFDAQSILTALASDTVLRRHSLTVEASAHRGQPQTGAMVVLPLRVADSVWGLVVFDGGAGAPPWQDAEVVAFTTASDAIAAAVARSLSDQALARQRAFASDVLAGIVDGVVASDATGRIAYANPALLRMLGRDLSDVIGRNLDDLGLGSSSGAPPTAGMAMTYNVRVETSSGERILEARPSPRPEAGRASQERVTVISDVTEQRRLAADLARALAAAEAASEAKTRFLGRVSHELRTPLNAIIGFAQLAALDADTPDLRDALDHIQRAGAHLNRLIADLLDVTTAETGDLRVAVERVELEAVVGEALELMRAGAPEAVIELSARHAAGTFVLADARRLTQVLLNLLGNAVKFAASTAPVEVSVTSDSVRGVGRVVVRDHGPGIAAADHDRIFTPFERLDNALHQEGTGIGLPLSRVLTERMGGRIGLTSREGAGASFWVEFPLAPSAAVANASRAS